MLLYQQTSKLAFGTCPFEISLPRLRFIVAFFIPFRTILEEQLKICPSLNCLSVIGICNDILFSKGYSTEKNVTTAIKNRVREKLNFSPVE